MNDLISRQAAIDALDALCDRECEYSKKQRSFMCGACRLGSAFDVIDELPSVQPEPAIPLSWIEGQIEWLKSLDNAFLTLTAGQISSMMNNWKDEQNEGFNQQTRCD